MIDLHFHCLPGIDDGPMDWDEAVAMCRAAAAEGTTSIVATPHVLRESWLNDDAAARDALILRLNTLLGGTPSVLPGCEFWYSADVVELVEKGESGPLTRVNRSRYLLVEFAPGVVPARAEASFHELELLNVVPLVAHPERNLAFQRSPERLASLVARGAFVQLTAGSLLGDFGRLAQSTAEEFVNRGLAHLVASDAHSLDVRPPRMAAAREKVRTAFGEETEMGLFESNPAAVVRNEPLPWVPKGRAS
ncbi:MAG TPA: protein tyrosine phosphatase [Thermoanaerobaculia bacterium]|nr:protein tyrosine phosphatase [Thermoanaerobaculia bacterium]HQR65944.1 protein tyrosine phosphatase [Thermoanaerobaculia bacterium]